MNSSKVDLSAEEIDAEIERQTKEMGERQRNGDYIEAEGCRAKIEQLKKDYELKRLSELKRKQRRETKKLENEQKEEAEGFENSYAKSAQEIKNEYGKLEEEMFQKHEEETKATENELNENLPSKLKESSELLNLKRIEEEMAKQKK